MNTTLEQVGEVCIGAVESIPAGEGKSFLLAGERIAVFRQRDGELFATQAGCPHRNGPLWEGVMGGGSVICPYHAYKFDLRTGACAQNKECSLKTYPVREEQGWVLVTLG